MKRILLFFGIALLLGACEQASEPFVVFDVETDYRLELRENLSGSNKKLLLEISTTIAGFTCEDAEIITQSSSVGNEITVNIKETRVPGEDCTNNGTFPAKAFLNLGELNAAEYQLTISIGETLFNYGTLIVTENSYEMVFDEELDGIEIPKPKLTKIPYGTIWGRLKYNDDNANVILLLSDLQGRLIGLGAAEKILSSGNYTNFEIDAEGVWDWHNKNTFMNERSLAYSYSEPNHELLRETLDSMNNHYGTLYDFELELFTYTGWEY